MGKKNGSDVLNIIYFATVKANFIIYLCTIWYKLIWNYIHILVIEFIDSRILQELSNWMSAIPKYDVSGLDKYKILLKNNNETFIVNKDKASNMFKDDI